jgi:hypothetical protein
LSLDRTPAAEVIPGTVSAWTEALSFGRMWDEERDTPRIRAAFATLARVSRHWPAPADFLAAMPAVDTTFKALPSRASDPERAKRAIAEVASLLARGGGHA